MEGGRRTDGLFDGAPEVEPGAIRRAGRRVEENADPHDRDDDDEDGEREDAAQHDLLSQADLDFPEHVKGDYHHCDRVRR